MNSRQRILLAVLLIVVIVGGGGFLVWTVVLTPLKSKGEAVAKLQKDIEERKLKKLQIQQNLTKLERWKKQSLPADIDLARREYEKFLSDTLRQSEFAPGTFTVAPKPVEAKGGPVLANKQPIYTKLGFTVTGRATLEHLVAMMKRFYTTGLLHQIKNIQVQRPLTSTVQQKPRELDVTMTIEALVINNGDKRPFLAPTAQLSAAMDLIGAKQRGVAGLAVAAMAVSPGGVASPSKLAPETRNYDAVTARNIFVGPPMVQVSSSGEDRADLEGLKYVYLTDITTSINPESVLNRTRTEAHLHDRMTNKSQRIQTRAGFNSIQVGDSQKPTLKGDVLRIDDREVYFKADDKYYAIRIGQNLAQAMKTALSADKVKELTGATTEAPKLATGPTP